MLPAPTTTAISTPRALTSCTCRVMASIRPGSVPYSSEPIRASPEIFSSTRLKTGSAIGGKPYPATGLFLADRVAREACDADVLARLRGQVGAQLLDRLALVAVGAHVLLLQEDHFRGPLAKLALDDLGDHVVGLALLLGLLFEDAPFRLALLGRNVLDGDIEGGGRSDVDRDLACELLEVVVARDEVGLALDLDQDARAAARVDVGGDRALARRAAGALRGRGL